MKYKIMMTMLIFVSVTITALLLRTTTTSEKHITDAENTHAKTSDIEIKEKLDLESLIAESKTSPIEKVSMGARWVDDVPIVETNRWTEFKRIPVDPDSAEVIEYVAIARAAPMRGKTDDIVPNVAVQGDTIIVSFPYKRPAPPEGMSEEEFNKGYRGPHPRDVIIDIKTKTVLWSPGME